MKLKSYIKTLVIASCIGGFTASCSDMLDYENGFTISPHMLTAADTVNYVVGILNKMQAIGVRTNLFGEVRADLVNVKSNANVDLKALANFNYTNIDDNQYNNPADYYAVIENCNFFLEHADSTLTASNKKVFAAERAAVRYIRAWAYLQLATVYGENIPLVLSTDGDSSNKKNLPQIVDYFLHQDNLQAYLQQDLPAWGSLDVNINPKNCFIPGYVIMGDLYLWDAVLNKNQNSAIKAAEMYYDYIVNTQNGKSYSNTSSNMVAYRAAVYTGDSYQVSSPSRSTTGTYGLFGSTSQYGYEVISGIGMDSTSADGYYNALRALYSYSTVPEFAEASIRPSSVLKNLSKEQQFCGYYTSNTHVGKFYTDDIEFQDQQIEKNMVGDLRFYNSYDSRDGLDDERESHTFETNFKHQQQDITLYRRTEIWLKFAEALNYAGFPRFASSVLVRGIDPNVLKYDILPYYTEAEQAKIKHITDTIKNRTDIRASQYYSTSGKRQETNSILTDKQYVNIGIHSRGCGFTQINDKYLAIAEQPLDSNVATHPYPRDPETGEYIEMTMPTKPDTVYAPYEYSKAKYNYETKEVEQFPLSEHEFKNIISYYIYYHTNAVVTTQKNYMALDKLLEFMVYHPEDSLYNVQPFYNPEEDYYSMIPYNEKTKRGTRDQNVDKNWDKYIDAYTTTNSYRNACEKRAQYDILYAAYEQDMVKYNAWLEDVNAWRAAACLAIQPIEQAKVDQLILDEQALEEAFEGKRYYDLMRRAFWHGSGWGSPDVSYIKDAILKRDSSIQGLDNKENWFMRWDKQIGPGATK